MDEWAQPGADGQFAESVDDAGGRRQSDWVVVPAWSRFWTSCFTEGCEGRISFGGAVGGQFSVASLFSSGFFPTFFSALVGAGTRYTGGSCWFAGPVKFLRDVLREEDRIG